MAGVLTVVLLPLALLSSWVAGVVTDTDRYVSTVKPLAEDPAVKKAVVRLLVRQGTELVDQVAGTVGLDAFLRQHGFDSVADSAKDQLAVLLRSTATVVVESAAFPDAWAAANRSAYTQLVAVLEGDDAVLDARGRVSLELGTLLNTVGAHLQEQGLLPTDLPEVKASFALVDADDLSRARHAYRVLDALGFWLPVLWLACLVTLLLATRNRGTTLRRQGALAMATMALLILGLRIGRDQIAGGTPDQDVAQAIWDVLVRDLEHLVWAVFALGSMLVLASAAGALLARRRQA